MTLLACKGWPVRRDPNSVPESIKDCPTVSALRRYYAEKMGTALTERIEDHLHVCAKCRDSMAAISRESILPQSSNIPYVDGS